MTKHTKSYLISWTRNVSYLNLKYQKRVTISCDWSIVALVTDRAWCERRIMKITTCSFWQLNSELGNILQWVRSVFPQLFPMGIYYTPRKHSYGGYTFFSLSVILSFCHSVIILTSLLWGGGGVYCKPCFQPIPC